MSLADLPHDVMLIVLAELALEDHFWLSMTCRYFHFVMQSDEICRMTLRVGFDTPSSSARRYILKLD